MKKIKNIIAMLLAAVMIFSLAACGPKAPVDETKPGESKPADNKPSDTQPVETNPAEREHVELIFYNYSNKEYPGQKETEEAINAYLKEKLNTTLEWHICLIGDYNANVSTHINSGGAFDIVFTRSGNVNFSDFAYKGAFYPLDDLVDQYLSGTKALLPEAAFDAMHLDGHQYGIPLPRDAAVNFNIQVNQNMLEDLGLTVPEYRTCWELVDWVYAAKAARDAKYPEKKDQTFLPSINNDLRSYYTADYILERMLAINVEGADGYKSQGDEAFCTYLTDEYRAFAKQMNQYVKDNVIPYDTTSFDPDKVMFKAGEFLFNWATGTIFIDENLNMPSFKTTLHQAKDSVLTTFGYQNGYAISADCQNVERALEVIELFNTDPYLATLLHFGPENIGWTDVDNDGIIEPGPANDVAPSDRYYWFWYGWNLGGLTVSKLPTGYPSNFVESLENMNNNALVSPVMGFTFKTEPVENELAACKNVIAEYEKTLMNGQNDNVDQLVDEFVQKLKDNGIDKVVAELNAQIDAFNADK